MRKLLILVSFVLISLNGLAQISETEARQIYTEAEELFEANNFYECYVKCDDLIQKMGKSNPKILYLLLNSIYNNLEKKEDKSVYTLKKNYRNFKIFNEWITDFFSMVDKNQYPSEKYNEMLFLQKYFLQGLQDYEHEKDRKPEDAISFLNECARKFPIRDISMYPNNYFDCNFSLEDSILQIDVLANLEQANFSGRQRIRIDLSKVWFENTQFQYEGKYYFHFYYAEFGKNYTPKVGHPVLGPDLDKDAPMLISTKSYIDGKAFYDNILWFFDDIYKKKYTEEKFEESIKKSGFSKLSSGFYIYNYFNQRSKEFMDNNYRKRIYDAFEFLITYYGGGNPIKSKQESKSKF